MQHTTFFNGLIKMLVLLLILNNSALAQTNYSYDYAPNEVLVKLKKGTTIQQKNALLNYLKAQPVERIASTNVELWRLPSIILLPDTTLIGIESIVNFYQNDIAIEYIEPNYIYSTSLTANDPNLNVQWGLNNEGQTGGFTGADIDAFAAWDIQKESPDIKIGVLDSGIDWKHPDLVNNIWQNLAEDADGDGRVLEYINNEWVFDPDDENGIDDDNNGFVDDFIGWDFVNEDNNPYDDHQHGTHVAGTIGAEGNNGIGITGVTWKVQLSALKLANERGIIDAFSAIRAIQYATQMGFDLTNNSWGGGTFSNILYDAIADAENAGQLFIAAAGNDSKNIDLSASYPASYDLDNIIAVASTNHFDNISSFSDFGATRVDLAAPGSNIVSTTPAKTYTYLSGTSMATPHVAGAVALLWASCPELSYLELKEQLLQTVDVIPSMQGKCVSNGRLNLLNALEGKIPLTFDFQINDLTVSFTPSVLGAGSYEWDFGDGTFSVEKTPTHTFTSKSNFNVCLSLINDCSKNVFCRVVQLQRNNVSPEDYFQKSIEGDIGVNRVSVGCLKQDEVISAGDFYYKNGIQTNRNGDIFISKIDLDGELVWQKSLLSPYAASIDFPYFIDKTSDNGFILGGITQRDQRAPYATFLTKFSSTEEIEWTRLYENTGRHTSQHFISLPTDGEYVMLSSPVSPSIPPSIFRVNTNYNNILWSNDININTNSDNIIFQPRDMILLSDNTILNYGNISNIENESKYMYLMKIDMNGKILWGRLYNTNEQSTQLKIQELEDKKLLLIGNVQEFDDAILMTVLDREGNIEKSKKISLTLDNNIFSSSISKTNENGFLISIYVGGVASNPIQMQLNKNLEIVWCKKIINDAFFTDISSPIYELDNALIRTYRSGGLGVLKTNLDGEIGDCTIESIDCTIQEINFFTPSNIFMFTTNPKDISINTSFQWSEEEDGNYVEEFYCQYTPCVASFTYEPTKICTNRTITFTNTAESVGTVEWLVDNEVISTQNSFTHTFPSTGTYTVTLNISNGTEECTTSEGIEVHTNANDLDLGDDLRICGNSTEIDANLSNMAAYAWDFNGNPLTSNSETITATQSGSYELAVVDSCGQIKLDTVVIALNTCDVWPGDVNYDGTVNVRDVLMLGVKNGKTGFDRPDKDLDWYAHPADNWGDTTPDGIDAKHGDCNGDGVIEIVADIEGVEGNYGKSHALGQYFPSSNLAGSLRLKPILESANIINNTANIEIAIELEDLVGNTVDFYGLSFTANYGGLGSSATVSTDNSLLSEDGNNSFSYYKDFKGRQLDAAIVRTEGNNINATSFSNKRVCKFVVIDENIVTDTVEITSQMQLKLYDILAIDNQGNPIAQDIAGSTATILFGNGDIAISGNSTSNNNLAAAIYANYSADCATGATATIQTFGGTSPYTYLWDNGATTAIVTDLTTGAHHVTITDANQQEVSGFIIIDGIPSIEVDYIIDEANCSITAEARGGVGNLSYNWSNGQSGSTANELNSGEHSVSIMDALGCERIETFTLSNSCSILPLELLDLSVTAQQSSVLINWKTANEQNIHSFQVQRSTDGRTFETIGRIAAKGTAISTEEQYLFTDKKISLGLTYYYRLKVIEKDDNHWFTHKYAIMLKDDSQKVNFFPNPTSNEGVLSFRNGIEGIVQISVYNQMGQLVSYRKKLFTDKTHSFSLNLQEFTSGIYMVKIQEENDHSILKVIKD